MRRREDRLNVSFAKGQGLAIFTGQRSRPGEFPGSSVSRTQHFHCQGPRVQSLVGELRSYKPNACLFLPHLPSRVVLGMGKGHWRQEKGEVICSSEPHLNYLLLQGTHVKTWWRVTGEGGSVVKRSFIRHLCRASSSVKHASFCVSN